MLPKRSSSSVKVVFPHRWSICKSSRFWFLLFRLIGEWFSACKGREKKWRRDLEWVFTKLWIKNHFPNSVLFFDVRNFLNRPRSDRRLKSHQSYFSPTKLILLHRFLRDKLWCPVEASWSNDSKSGACPTSQSFLTKISSHHDKPSNKFALARVQS